MSNLIHCINLNINHRGKVTNYYLKHDLRGDLRVIKMWMNHFKISDLRAGYTSYAEYIVKGKIPTKK